MSEFDTKCIEDWGLQGAEAAVCHFARGYDLDRYRRIIERSGDEFVQKVIDSFSFPEGIPVIIHPLEVIDMLDNSPETFEKLFPVLAKHPLLLRVYSPIRIDGVDDGLKAERLGNSRISRSKDAQTVSEQIKATGELARRLYDKYGLAKFEGSSMHYEERVASVLDGVADVYLGLIDREGEKWVRIKISPSRNTKKRGDDFGSYAVNISLSGLVDSSLEQRYYVNDFGYLLKENNYGMQETALVNALLEVDEKERDSKLEKIIFEYFLEH